MAQNPMSHIDFFGLDASAITVPGYFPPRAWHAHQRVVDAFYTKSLKEDLDVPRYSFNEQYAIYLYGNQVQHPPAIYLADPFASQGKSIVLLLSIAPDCD